MKGPSTQVEAIFTFERMCRRQDSNLRTCLRSPATLTGKQASSPLAKRVYDLHHGNASLLLNAGVTPTEVARRLGHSVAILLQVYAGCLDGEEQTANERIDEALARYEKKATETPTPEEPTPPEKPETDEARD